MIRAKLADAVSFLLAVALAYGALVMLVAAFRLSVNLNGEVAVMICWLIWRAFHGAGSIAPLVRAVRRWRHDRFVRAVNELHDEYMSYRVAGRPPGTVASSVQTDNPPPRSHVPSQNAA